MAIDYTSEKEIKILRDAKTYTESSVDYKFKDKLGSTTQIYNTNGNVTATPTYTFFSYTATTYVILAATGWSGGQSTRTWVFRLKRSGTTNWVTLNSITANSVMFRTILLRPGDAFEFYTGGSSTGTVGHAGRCWVTPVTASMGGYT